jgi:site-specific DNA-methyltransferase (adenine-specific)
MILIGDVREKLKELPDQSVHCVVTSPPYFGLRDYGKDGQIGMEETPDKYVEQMVTVFREVWRVLRDDGTLWLNLGDSYASFRDGKVTPDTSRGDSTGTLVPKGKAFNRMATTFAGTSIKHKDLIGIPWRVAFALQAEGWYLRQDIIWHKPNPMPESVTDRCTKSHEYMFLLSKSRQYYFDHEAIKEQAVSDNKPRKFGASNQVGTLRKDIGRVFEDDGLRNKRDVWSVPVRPFKGAHFATFPPALIEPCILAGTSAHGVCEKCLTPYERIMVKGDIPERKTRDKMLGAYPDRKTTTRLNSVDMVSIRKTQGGWKQNCDCITTNAIPATVLDPFFGAGTTGLVSQQHGRNWIGCELNPVYAEIASKRIEDATPQSKLFT